MHLIIYFYVKYYTRFHVCTLTTLAEEDAIHFFSRARQLCKFSSNSSTLRQYETVQCVERVLTSAVVKSKLRTFCSYGVSVQKSC